MQQPLRFYFVLCLATLALLFQALPLLAQEMTSFDEFVNQRDLTNRPWMAYMFILEKGTATDFTRELKEGEFKLSERNGIGRSLLHQAAIAGRVDIVKELLALGASVTAVDNLYGNTPLHEAAAKGNAECGILLLDKGAEVNAKNKNDETPLHVAAGNGNLEFAEMLINHLANLNARDKDQVTPLQCAVAYGDDPTVQLLLSHGADVNAAHGEAWDLVGNSTALHMAAEQGDQDICATLVEAGADVNLLNKDAKKAIDLARAGGFKDVVDYLATHGSK